MQKPENKKPNGNEKEKKTLFSELGRLFGSIAEVIGKEVKHDKIVSLQQAHRVSANKKIRNLLIDAKAVVNNLQAFKEQLIQEFGNASYNFITKSIDPIIEHALLLIEELSARQEVERSFAD